jgi:hypothetical protein
LFEAPRHPDRSGRRELAVGAEQAVDLLADGFAHCFHHPLRPSHGLQRRLTPVERAIGTSGIELDRGDASPTTVRTVAFAEFRPGFKNFSTTTWRRSPSDCGTTTKKCADAACSGAER